MISLTLLGISPFSLSYNISHPAIGSFLYGFPPLKENGAASVNLFLWYAGISKVGWAWSKQDVMSEIDAQTLR